MKFAVHVMPPPPKQRPPDVRASSTPMPSSSSPSATPPAHPHAPLKSLAVPIDPQCSFADLWKEAEKRFRRGFDKDKLAGMYFSHLQDSEGGYITVSDTVGSMYREDAPASERQLYMYVDEVDRENTIPIDSELRPREFRKRRWMDMDAAEQASVKRRRHEEERYGARLDELDADTPILSRESGSGDTGAAGTGVRSQQNDMVRMDADGFKIPARPNQVSRKHQARPAQRSPIVLVNSSQPDEHSASQEPPTPDSTDRRSGGDTPPSAQRPAPTQQDGDAASASPKTPPTSAFAVLGKRQSKSASKSGSKHWSAEEDEIILKGIREGWNTTRMLKEMPGSTRSDSGIRNRRIKLMSKPSSSKRRQPHAKSELRHGEQTLEVTSSPPVASGSTAPLSSPCEAARCDKSPADPIAYVQLTHPPRQTGKSSPEPPHAEPVAEHVHCQTATPPTSNASETSGGRLRAPASGPSNASRLRRARTNMKPLVLGARVRDADKVAASVAATDEEVGLEEDSHRADPVKDTPGKAMPHPETPDLSVASDDVENRRDFSNTTASQVTSSPKDDVPNVQAVPDAGIPAQPTPEVTLPKRKKNSIYHNRTDEQRWKEALEYAKGDKARARDIFIVNLNKEDMLDAVTASDEPEIARLKAQRRRRERELAVSKGLPAPKRRVPLSLLGASNSRPDLHDADEDVVREDDWTTDEGEGHKEMDVDLEEEEDDDEGAMYNSDDDDDFLDVEARLDGPRVAELESTPPPAVGAVDAGVVDNDDAVGDEPLGRDTINDSKNRSSTDRGPPEFSSKPSARNKKVKRPSTTHRSSHLSASSEVDSEDAAGRPSTSSPDAKSSSLPKAAAPSATMTSRTSEKSRKREDASARSSTKQAPATPAKPPPKATATPSSKHSQPGKKKMVVTPKAKLTREAALAAHLAECKRKEALYLNNDEDDDDEDDDSSASDSS